MSLLVFLEKAKKRFAKKLMNLLKKSRIYTLHVFPYSMRKGTPAARMVQVDVKKLNMKELIV